MGTLGSLEFPLELAIAPVFDGEGCGAGGGGGAATV
jgi:hypothetical protein